MSTSARAKHRRAAHVAVFLLACSPALAQDVAPEVKRQELEERRGDLGRARESETHIRSEIEGLARERTDLAKDLVATAGRIRDIETKITDSEARLANLSDSEADVRRKLEKSRAVVAELLGALQRMGRQPPPALIVKPEDALSSIRSAMLLGAVLPEIREQAEELADDLAELNEVRRDISAERNRLAADRADLEAGQVRIAFLVDARQRRQNEREKALADEHQRAEQLSLEVDSLEELIGRMERDIASTRAAADAAAKAEALAKAAPPPSSRAVLAALSDPGRLSPAVSFDAAKGLLPLPASGSRLRGFNETDDFGSAQKGQSILTRADAQVTAPCDGWVVYAGPFRSYGQLLILNAGGGYHVLLAGMEKISVSLGQFVLTGEPVAEMGADTKVASIVSANAAQPVLYVEFRKDGQSIDPGPWWAINSSEKVRG